ncbi:YCF48-related protein [Variovorax sp. J22P240]|uniref:YCF48-related protein n=1 Tax=Variovorax sp. J22P240 TaxID=3053514 RepID=UPI002574EC69|nr:YCF48-related protein [Variovorax sp. J22P240]MDM0003105.1 YCF48-related protein [Variovorax sp. J22P240]
MLISATAWLQAPNPRPLQAAEARSVWDWFRYPLETNASARLPSAPGALYGIHATADAKRVWAVGDAGTIVATADGGRTWAAQNSGVRVSLSSVVFASDGQRGWAVGDGGAIVATADGGRTWAAQTSGVRVVLSSVVFASDGQRGWAVGDSGTILATADGGRTWAAQTSGVQARLQAVVFASDGQRGWAVGDSGTILATADGGRTWATQTSGVQSILRSVVIASDGQRGWAVGEGGTIVATADGGRTWAAQTSGVREHLWSVVSASAGLRGWAVGEGGTIVATADGGRTWAAQTSGVSEVLYAVVFASDGQRGWAVGTAGTILATADGGRMWAAQTRGVQALLLSVVFASDDQRGWVVGGGGTIVATADGGRTWAAQTSGVRADLRSVVIASDGQRGWAVGAYGTIVATADGGRTWAAQTSGVGVDLRSVVFASDGQRGWAVGDLGIILATADGGRTWAAQTSGVQSLLRSVAIASDGLHGWAVGDSGTIVATADGGRTWAAQTSGVRASLFSVVFASDGQRGWAVGGLGTILATADRGTRWAPIQLGPMPTMYTVAADSQGRSVFVAGAGGFILQSDDGGEHWSRRDSQVGSSRLALWMSDDARRLWAVGYPPALVHSEDGGQTWRPKPWPLRHARYPAPWFWIGLLLLPIFVRQALRRQTADQDSGAAAMGASDAPAHDFSQDRLQFGPLARGLSRFLRNQATEPPLTVAISGDWGSGKSSLMHLVCRDLERYGCRPVWFNAWHHQNDDQLLAALLSAVRDQGLPRLLSLDGLAFRLRLLWTRSAKHYVLTFLCLAAVAATVAFVTAHDNAAWTRLWADLNSLFGAGVDSAGKGGHEAPQLRDWSRLLAPIATLIAAITAVYRALKAFGSDPAVLLTTLSENFRLKDAQAVTNFRARFGEQFREVAEALPYRTVIVIDDLDRCKPEAVLTVMESVNFLMSSGRCLVIFGMATHRVQAALAMSFEKIAKEVVVLNLAGPDDPNSDLNPEDAERERRRHYAQDYLEKLINLEVQVPAREDLPAHLLLLAPAEDHGDGWRAAAQGMAGLLPLAGLLLAVAAGLMFGWKFDGFRHAAPDPVVQVAPPAASAAPLSSGSRTRSVAPSAPPAAAASGPAVPVYVPSMQHGEDGGIAWTAIVLPVAATLLLMLGYFVWRLRENTRAVRDSAAFTRALEAWAPVVRGHRGTPRAVKRFGNRVRYLAMLQQAEQLDESGWDLLWRRLIGARPGAANVQRDPEDPPPNMPPVLEEHRIVALGALHEVWGSDWRARTGPPPSESTHPQQKAHAAAVADYVDATGASWPPSAEEMDAFERTLKGVRLPGDPGVIAARGPIDPAPAPDPQRQ